MNGILDVSDDDCKEMNDTALVIKFELVFYLIEESKMVLIE